MSDDKAGSHYRVCSCGTAPTFGVDEVSITQSANGVARASGLMRCGSVWLCAECASIIEAERGREVAQLILNARESCYHVLMLTFTIPHARGTPLKESMDALAGAMRTMRQDRKIRNLQASLGFAGLVRSTEITYGANGWHAHIHELWVIQADPAAFFVPLGVDQVQASIQPIWARFVRRWTGRESSVQHGLDVREVWSANDYLAKMPDAYARREATGKPRWGADAEMTKSALKVGRVGSRVIWQLIDDAALGDQQASSLVRDYARGTWRRRRMYWTPSRTNRKGVTKLGLRDLFGLRPEVDDEALVQQHVEPLESGDLIDVEVRVPAGVASILFHDDPSWCDTVLEEAGPFRSIVDLLTFPLYRPRLVAKGGGGRAALYVLSPYSVINIDDRILLKRYCM